MPFICLVELAANQTVQLQSCVSESYPFNAGLLLTKRNLIAFSVIIWCEYYQCIGKHDQAFKPSCAFFHVSRTCGFHGRTAIQSRFQKVLR